MNYFAVELLLNLVQDIVMGHWLFPFLFFSQFWIKKMNADSDEDGKNMVT